MLAIGKTAFSNQLNQSYKFYQVGHETRKMRQRQNQRVKLQVDFDDKNQTLMQVVQTSLMLSAKFVDNYGRPLKSRDLIRRR